MRTPLWIIDFNADSQSQDFLDRWWKAYGQNIAEPPQEDDLWYHVTRVTEQTYEDILDEAGHLTLIRDEKGPLIPAFKRRPAPNTLNVVFLGDVTDEKQTIPHFHFWATRLRAALLKDETQWTTITRVHFYGMLWRPNTAAVAPGISSPARGFLHELNMLMKQDVNHAPFRSVAFVESANRSEALEKMNLAMLHLSGQDFLNDDNQHRFVDLSASGVFYEAAVHTAQGAHLLSNALVEKIAHSKEREFYDAPAAQSYVDGQTDFLETFSCETLVATITDNCPALANKADAYDLQPSISPWSLKLKKVWTEYYCDYIPNYKKNLVNRVKRSLKTFVRDYREMIFSNQKETITRVADMLQKQVFRIFTDETASKYISLAQAEEILRRYAQKIEEVSKDVDDTKIAPFAIPSELKKAAEQARVENRTPQEALAVLESKISRHPVAVFALLIRAIVLGGLLGFLTWNFTMPFTEAATTLVLTAVAGLLPLAAALLQFRVMQIRIEALKQQYVGVMLVKCEEELRTDIQKCLEVTYQELLQYCGWLKEYKFNFLRNHLAVLSPSEFSFVESAALQPLVKAGKESEKEKNVILIPPVDPTIINSSQLSGTFDHQPLLDFESSTSFHKINIEGINHDLNAVLRDNELLAILVRRLMTARTKVKQSIEREATFHSRSMQGRTLLLLDISGSMNGQPLADLKKAVHNLEESYDVEWIAFSDNVVASSFDEKSNIDSLSSMGGTNFIPPLTMAAQKIREELFDSVILISDGSPFETTEAILTVAQQLQIPLNTISIGNSGASVMKELSDKTGGTQIVVDEVKEIIRWEGKMQAIVQLGENGEFSFGELLAKCHIPGCARALHDFAAEQVSSEATALSSLIARYPGKGLAEWGLYAKSGAQRKQTAEVLDKQYILGVDRQAAENEKFVSCIKKYLEDPTLSEQDAPLMIATLIMCRGIALNDFSWAGLDENSADLNDREQLTELLYGNPTICNLYDRPIR